MTIYPARRRVQPVLWFIGCVLLVFVVALAWYSSVFPGTLIDRWMVAIAVRQLDAACADRGPPDVHVGLDSAHAPAGLDGTGWLRAGGLVCVATGWLTSVLFIDTYEDRHPDHYDLCVGRDVVTREPNRSTLSARLDSLIGAADALRMGRYQARVEVEGSDQLAQLAMVFNGMADKVEHVDRKRQLTACAVSCSTGLAATCVCPCRRPGLHRPVRAEGGVDNPETYMRFRASHAGTLNALSDLMDDLYDMSLARAAWS